MRELIQDLLHLAQASQWTMGYRGYIFFNYALVDGPWSRWTMGYTDYNFLVDNPWSRWTMGYTGYNFFLTMLW